MSALGLAPLKKVIFPETTDYLFLDRRYQDISFKIRTLLKTRGVLQIFPIKTPMIYRKIILLEQLIGVYAQYKKLIQAYKKIIHVRNLLKKRECINTFEQWRKFQIKNFVSFLVSETNLSIRLLNPLVFSAIFLEKNHFLLNEALNEILSIAKHQCLKLNCSCLSEEEEKRIEIFIGNLIALVPFFEPETGKKVNIPQKNQGRWIMVSYVVEKIQITPTYLGDPFYIYGLKPTSKGFIHPILIFTGTPLHPTGSGSLLGRWTDFTPGYTVGESLYNHFASSIIQKWIVAVFEEYSLPIKFYGTSLGGSLALVAGSHQPQYLLEINAYVSPAPLESTLKRYHFNCIALKNIPHVNIYCQESDLISRIGYGWHPTWNVCELSPLKKYSYVESHVRAFSGMQHTKIKKIDIQGDINKRRFTALTLEVLKMPLFTFTSFHLALRSVWILANKQVVLNM